MFQSSSASEPAPDHDCLVFRRHSSCFNPRVRANPHPTTPQKEPVSGIPVSILECERTRTRRAKVGGGLPNCNGFQSSSASEPAPDILIPTLGASKIVSILECERTRTRPCMPTKIEKWTFVSILECERTRTRPHNCIFCEVFQVSILECERTRTRPELKKTTQSFNCFNPRVRANPHPTARPDHRNRPNKRVSILECERTRTRQPPPEQPNRPKPTFQSSSASEPAPDNWYSQFRAARLRFNPRVRANPHPTV